MKKSILINILISAAAATPVMAQQNGITDTRNSKYAIINSTPISAVKWTGGFWGERFGVFSGTSLQSMWETWKSDKGHSYNNFMIAAGEKKGKRHGPPFHDGDMYKWLEAVAAVYAVNKDPELEKIMDRVIELIAKAQRPDGYLHTPVVIAEINKKALQDEEKENETIGTKVGTSKDGRFGNPLNFEAYNLGHLITAGIIHHRATGKTSLLDCAIKAADCLYDFYMNPSADALEKGVICPSHYMAITEIYRETGNPKYLELSKQLINIRDSVKNGTDDNQDRIPFRQQYNAMGHSVRANYLYAGVADLYVEDGEAQLKKTSTQYGTTSSTARCISTEPAAHCMTALRPTVLNISQTLYKKYTRATAAHISCPTLPHTTKPAPTLATCCSIGVCSRTQQTQNTPTWWKTACSTAFCAA